MIFFFSSFLHTDGAAFSTSTSFLSNDLQLWHARMGHVNIPTIHGMNIRQSLLDFKLDSNDLLPHPCEGYMKGK